MLYTRVLVNSQTRIEGACSPPAGTPPCWSALICWRDRFPGYSVCCLVPCEMITVIRVTVVSAVKRLRLLPLTLKADVPQVQYGCQQLENGLMLLLWEEQFHRGMDLLINFSVISALAPDTCALQQVWVCAKFSCLVVSHETTECFCGTFVRNMYSWASPRDKVSLSSAEIPASMQ